MGGGASGGVKVVQPDLVAHQKPKVVRHHSWSVASMEAPGEKLLTRVWETFTEKGPCASPTHDDAG